MNHLVNNVVASLAVVAFRGGAPRDRWLAVLVVTGVLALVVLILIDLLLRRRSARAAGPAPIAEPRGAELEKLHHFIQNATQLDLHRKPGPQLAALVQSIFEVEAVAIFDADLHEVYRAGEWFGNLDDLVQNIYFFEKKSDDAETGLARRVLRMGNLPIGALLLRGEIAESMTNAVASLIAITFDRYHALANESRTEMAREAEQLRTTVLDSLAHAYKTPLTAIRAASTGLSEMGGLTPNQSGLVALIDEQAGLLSHLTTRLLKTARLGSRELTLHIEPVAIAPLIEDVVASLRDQLSNVLVQVAVPREDLSIRADRELLVSLLTQYVENAGKYATAGTTVTIRAAERPGQVILSVHSLGPVIPAADHERVFDRYFRSSVPANQAPGTGIGLSVAKRAAQAHGGQVRVTSDSSKGTTFFASLPKDPEGGSV